MKTQIQIPHVSETTLIGVFANDSGLMRISDPCYKSHPELAPVFQARKGHWIALSYMRRSVRNLLVHHVGTAYDAIQWNGDIAIPIETGTFAIVDDRRHVGGDELMDLHYEKMYGQERSALLPFGVIAGNAFGDGCFLSLLMTSKKGLLNAIAIGIADADDDDDDDDDEGEPW